MSGPMPDSESSFEKSSRQAMSRRIPSASWLVQFQPTAPGQVALLVGGRVDVDLDEADGRVVEVGLGPVGVDEDLGGVAGDGHGDGLLRAPAGWLDVGSGPPISGIGPAGDRGSDTRGSGRPHGAHAGQPSPPARSSRLKASSALAAGGQLALGLADDPRVDAAASPRSRSSAPYGAVVERRSPSVAVVGHPVRLELEDRVGDDAVGEEPVEVGRVQPIDDVGDPDRPAALESGEQADDPGGRERVAGFGDRRRAEVRLGQARRGVAERALAGRGSRGCHVDSPSFDGISDWASRDCGAYHGLCEMGCRIGSGSTMPVCRTTRPPERRPLARFARHRRAARGRSSTSRSAR